MKYFITLALIFAVSTLSFAQKSDFDNTRLYEIKVTKFAKMKQTGQILIGVGAVSTIGGIALMVQGYKELDNNNQNSGNYYQDDFSGKFLGGYLLTLLGLTSVGGGTALAIIGNNKQKQYQRKLDNLRLGYYQSSGANGVSLVYRF